jgi:UDP-glucose 4-epimerase
MKLHLVAGGAGFVGVNLVRRLLARGDAVAVCDDLSRGRRELLPAETTGRLSFHKVDCSEAEALGKVVSSLDRAVDEVWHMAANSDIPAGVEDPRVDLYRTFLTTVGILEMMRRFSIGCLHFASSSAIYGDLGDLEIHENIGPLEPISYYGAMKLASEAHIRAAVEAFLSRANVFRFPNVIGVPATHGVIIDFVRKLRGMPRRLEVLGNGTQTKAYLHVDELVDAMLHIRSLAGRYCVFNIGPSDAGITVRQIAEMVRDAVSPGAEIVYGGGDRGWVGDVPRFRYSVAKLKAAGWRARLGSADALSRAIHEIVEQER